jgi:hypothetical protein
VRSRQIRGNIYLLQPDQKVNDYVGARSEGVNPLTGHIQKKIDLSVPDQKKCILSEARSEGTKLHRGKIRGDISLFGTRSERIYTSCSQMRENEASWGGQIRGIKYLLKPHQRE